MNRVDRARLEAVLDEHRCERSIFEAVAWAEKFSYEDAMIEWHALRETAPEGGGDAQSR